MSLAVPEIQRRSAGRSNLGGISASVLRWLPLLLVFATAALLRHFFVTNTDVSWGITMAEKVLDGQRLYVDVIEVNPPATVFLYIVPVLIARALSWRPELMVDTCVFLAAGVSLWFSGRLLIAARICDKINVWPLAVLFAAALMLLPARTFAEREHIALIIFLPVLALLAMRAKGAAPSLTSIIVSGIAAGFIVIIKPHFVFAIAFTAIAAALCIKSWKLLFVPEFFIAGAMAVLYLALVAVYFPIFFSDMVPLLAMVYLPIKVPFSEFIVRFATPLWVTTLFVIVMLKRKAVFGPPGCLLLAASFGFAIPYYLQQKGWPYHSYPMLALALIAAAIAFVERWHGSPTPAETMFTRSLRLATAFTLAVLTAITFCWMILAVDVSALAEPIRKIKAHPKIIAITSDIGIGHPLTRQVEGTWVGRVGSLWITTGAKLRQKREILAPELQTRLMALAERDRVMLTEDIERTRPDIILIERPDFAGYDWKAWAATDPAISRQLKAYREIETINGIAILRRETINPPLR